MEMDLEMDLEELKSKDITPDLEIIDEEEKEEKKEIEEKGDHPAVILLDMAVEQSAEMCKKNKLPPPNMKFYSEFSRPFLNKAFWYYFPSGELPDSPKLALLLGVAGLGLAYIPTIVAYYSKNKNREKEENKEKKKEETKEIEIEQNKERENKERAPKREVRKSVTAFG